MLRDKTQHGLTNLSLKNTRCERCEIPLKLSQYKNQTVFYSNNKKMNCGFYCYSCATKLEHVTIQELDNYLLKQIGSISFFMKRVII